MITLEMLAKDSVEKTISDIVTLMNYENLLASGTNLDDIKLYLDTEKMFSEQQ
jgi:hypothetical protein